MVKGAFRAKNSYQGNFDLLVLSEISLAGQRRALPLLRQRRLLHHYPRLHRHLNAFAHAALVGELVKKGTQEGQKIQGLFPLVLRTLDALDRSEAPPGSVLLTFQGALLGMLGYRPVLDRCVHCSTRPPSGSLLRVYPVHGGVVCRHCRRQGDQGLDLSWNASRLVLSTVHPAYEAEWVREASVIESKTAWDFFELFFQFFLEKRINSYAFINQLRNLV
jgi:DNA repair protein RecO